MADEIISRADAQARGLKRYFLGDPCSAGHIAERHVSTCLCVECVRLYNRKYREENSEKLRSLNRRYREENADKVNNAIRRWREKNSEKVKKFGRKWYEKNAEKVSANSRKWVKENPDKELARTRRYREENRDEVRARGRKWAAETRIRYEFIGPHVDFENLLTAVLIRLRISLTFISFSMVSALIAE